MDSIFELLQDVILSNVGHLEQTPSGYNRCNCMMCAHRGHKPDTRKRFGVKMENDNISMNCFNCKFSVGWEPGKKLSENFISFLKVIGVSDRDIKRIDYDIFVNRKNVIPPVIVEKDVVTKKWIEEDLPEGTYPFSVWLENGCNDPNFLQSVAYAKQRGFYDASALMWTPLKKNQWNRRIVFPFTYGGINVGYSGRYNTEPKNKNLPRYMNHMPVGFLYNLDEQHDSNKYVIVTEGMIDAFVTHGVSTLGEITSDQVSIINSLGKTVIVCPDRDKDGVGLVNAAIENGWGVSFPRWKNTIKDPAKAVETYGKVATVQSIIQGTETGKFSIRLKRRMDKFKG